MIPLDRNESYWLLDEGLVDAARKLGVSEFSTYPEYEELKEMLAAYAGVTKDMLLVTPGSDAAIEHVAREYAGTGGEVILPVPTFYGYETILDRVGIDITAVSYEERDGRFVFPLSETLDAMGSGSAKIVFLCHPNNPLGSPLSNEAISEIARAAREHDLLVVSDEAYFEFSSGTSFQSFLSELPNLVIVRTLSKAFGLSGARVGYVMAAPTVVQRLKKVLLPWPVAHPSVAAACALLAREDAVRERREMLIEERERFVEGLRTISGISVYPSETNFVLIRVADAARARDQLISHDIRVALGEPMTRFPDAKNLLRNTLRIAIPAPKSREIVLDVLRESLI